MVFSSSKLKDSDQTKAKSDSDAIISGEPESSHALVDSETNQPDSRTRKRRSSVTVKDSERSSSRLDESIPRASKKTNRKDETTKRRSESFDNTKGKKEKSRDVFEKPTSRAGSAEKKKRKNSDPTSTTVQSSKPRTPLPGKDALDSTHKESSEPKSIRELCEERHDLASQTVQNKVLKVQMKNDLEASACVLEMSCGRVHDVAREPSLTSVENRRRREQVENGTNVKARRKTNSTRSVLIPQRCDSPSTELPIDVERFKKSRCELGEASTDMLNSEHDVDKLAKDFATLEIPLVKLGKDKESYSALSSACSDKGLVPTGKPHPRDIGAGTDIRSRRDLDASRDFDRKPSSVTNLETRRRLHQVENAHLTSNERINPQSCNTSTSGVSMDDMDLMESLYQESFLDLGPCAPVTNTQTSDMAVELPDPPEVPFASKEKKSQRKPSVRRSASCSGTKSGTHEAKILRGRRALKRHESYTERTRCKQVIGGMREELHEMTTMEVKDNERYEIPLRDDSANKVVRQKTSRARRGRRKSSDETRRRRQQDRDTHQDDTLEEHYYFDLHIPQDCGAPVSGISMHDLEWMEELYAKSILD